MSNDISSHPLTFEQIEEIAMEAISTCHTFVPGKSEKDKKEWCEQRIISALEAFDNFIPVIGAFLDNPIVDNIEAHAISMLVEWAWGKFFDKKA